MLRFEPTPCPLLLGSDGTIRVTGSAVALELVVGAFDAGATPEQIAHHCPSLPLATIYSVVSYVLRQRADVDLYLQRRAHAAASGPQPRVVQAPNGAASAARPGSPTPSAAAARR